MMGFVDIINDVGESEYPTDEREGDLYRMVCEAEAGLIITAWNPHNARELPFTECIQNIVKQLKLRIEMALDCGIEKDAIVLDPGIGFGKGLDNDMRLIAYAPQALAHLGYPVLIGHSRKRCIAKSVDLPIEQLDEPTAMATAIALMQGASIVRVHHPKLSCYARQIALSCALDLI